MKQLEFVRATWVFYILSQFEIINFELKCIDQTFLYQRKRAYTKLNTSWNTKYKDTCKTQGNFITEFHQLHTQIREEFYYNPIIIGHAEKSKGYYEMHSRYL